MRSVGWSKWKPGGRTPTNSAGSRSRRSDLSIFPVDVVAVIPVCFVRFPRRTFGCWEQDPNKTQCGALTFAPGGTYNSGRLGAIRAIFNPVFFFKQKTAYDIHLPSSCFHCSVPEHDLGGN